MTTETIDEIFGEVFASPTKPVPKPAPVKMAIVPPEPKTLPEPEAFSSEPSAPVESEYVPEKYQFDDDFQAKIAALSLRDPHFVALTEGLVRPEYFDSPIRAFVYSCAEQYYAKYKTLFGSNAALVEYLSEQVKAKKLPEPIRAGLSDEVRRLLKTSLTDAKYIADRVSEFARHQAVQEAMLRSVNYLTSRDFPAIEKALKEALTVGLNADVRGEDYFETIEARTLERKDRFSGKTKPTGITSGVKELDRALYHKGWGRKELTVFMGGAKKGKCVKRDTLLLTEHGMVEIGDYVPHTTPVGSFAPIELQLLGRNGMEQASHIYNNGLSKTLRVVTERGLIVEGTENHPMLVMDADGYLVWRELADLKVGDNMVVQRGQRVFGSTIDLSYAIHDKISREADITLPDTMTPELAEFIGMIVAEAYFGKNDGCIRFTQKNETIANRFVELVDLLFDYKVREGKKHNGCFDLTINSVRLKRYFAALGLSMGLSASQVMPLAIRVSPEPCVRAFLSALIGLECHVRSGKSKKNISIDLCMASEQMIKQVQIALLNYGIFGHMSLKRCCATNGKKIMRNYWRLKISGGANLEILREIGLYEDRKNAILSGCISLPSTERNWIPNSRKRIGGVVEEIKAAKGEYQNILGQTLARSLRAVRLGKESEARVLTYNLAQMTVEALNNHAINGPNCDWLREIVKLNYAFDPIKTITKSECETVDFTVPGTHSFHTNGLVSHNSTALGYHALKACLAGYNVLYITLEVSTKIIKERMDACLSEIPMNELIPRSNDVEKAITSKGAIAGRGLFKMNEFPPGSFKPTDLRRLIESYRSKGQTFDLMVVDYLDIMAPDVYTREPIENSKQIWLASRAIAVEQNVAVLTATQTNRDGFKNDTARAEHAAEDFNKVRIADLMISINSTDEEREKGLARLYFAASRNQAGGFTISIKQDLATMRFITGVEGAS